MTDRPDLDAIAAREQAASKEVARLCNGGRWEMQVPARDDADSDMVISRSLSDIDVLLAEVRRLTAENADLHRQLNAGSDYDALHRDETEARIADARREERERCASLIARVRAFHPWSASELSNRIRALPDEDTPTTTRTSEWDAVYEPGNVSTVHIGRFPTRAGAKAAAEKWHRDHTFDEPGPVFWERLRDPEGWRLVERHDPCTESGIRVRVAGSEGLFLCPSCETLQPLATSRRRDDYGQRWCRICDDATPERPARTTTEETPEDDGRTWTTVRVQRACNGCGNDLRDVNQAELDAVVAGRPLPDVTGECPTCTPACTTEEAERPDPAT